MTLTIMSSKGRTQHESIKPVKALGLINKYYETYTGNLFLDGKPVSHKNLQEKDLADVETALISHQLLGG